MLRLILEAGDHRMAQKTGRLIKITKRDGTRFIGPGTE